MTTDSAVKPIVIGVSGGSGSGKTTVVGEIIKALGHDKVTIVAQDYYYFDRSDVPVAERADINYDHPDAFETSLMVEHLRKLRDGQPTEVPVYDFAEHTRKQETLTLLPRKVIIVEGILILADAELRAIMDIKAFVDADADLRILRRLERDVIERGRSLKSVMHQYLKTVRPMHLEFVEPSKRYANVIIPEGGHNKVAIDMMVTKVRSILKESTGDGA